MLKVRLLGSFTVYQWHSAAMVFNLLSLLHLVSSLTNKFSQRFARSVFGVLHYLLIILTSVSPHPSFVFAFYFTFFVVIVISLRINFPLHVVKIRAVDRGNSLPGLC